MAVAGSKKALSKEHEEYVAKRYEGRRSPSSGASITDLGDVRDETFLIECKGQFGERLGSKPVRSTLLNQFEKIADEAMQGDRIPAVALRFYKPESALANNEGFVDLIVKLVDDDLFQLKREYADGVLWGVAAGKSDRQIDGD